MALGLTAHVFRLSHLLDQDTLSMLRQQIRLLWLLDSAAVADLGKRPGASALVMQALAELTPAELGHFVRTHSRR
jgi:hypothetical protein